LIDLVLIMFCRKRKRDEHVTRPSIVNPPFSSEKVNAENGYSRSKWWPWVNAGYQEVALNHGPTILDTIGLHLTLKTTRRPHPP
ncbi:hypothetical protein Tco_1412712, partial [Tanacetum coccineum]